MGCVSGDVADLYNNGRVNFTQNFFQVHSLINLIGKGDRTLYKFPRESKEKV